MKAHSNPSLERSTLFEMTGDELARVAKGIIVKFEGNLPDCSDHVLDEEMEEKFAERIRAYARCLTAG